MAGNSNEIVLRVENIIAGTTGGAGQQGAVPMNGITQTTPNLSKGAGFAQGISAQMFVESASRIISASGNSELASGLSKASSYAFLGGRVIASGGTDVAALVSLVTKIGADVLQAITESNQSKREAAIKDNNADILRMRSGAFSINANTQISYNRFGRVSFTGRK